MKKTFLALFLFTTASLVAQTTSGQTPGSAAVQAKLQGFLSSLSYFSSGNLAQGEAVLEQPNVQQPGTASWHTESAVGLVHVVHYFVNTGNRPLAYSIAKLALGHLQTADQGYTAASNAAEVANEKELQGMLYEQFFSDRATAETFYAAAVALSPKTGLAASALLRLQEMDASEAQKRAYAASNQ